MLVFLITLHLSTGQVLEVYKQSTYTNPKYRPFVKIEKCIEHAKLKEERLLKVIKDNDDFINVTVTCQKITKEKWLKTRRKK